MTQTIFDGRSEPGNYDKFRRRNYLAHEESKGDGVTPPQINEEENEVES